MMDEFIHFISVFVCLPETKGFMNMNQISAPPRNSAD